MKETSSNTLLWVLFALCSVGSAWAQQRIGAPLSMPAVYTSHMVLQHARPLPIEGTATAGAHLKINMEQMGQVGASGQSSQTITVQTDSLGHWQAILQPLQAGGPYTLIVSDGQDTLRYEDVLAGEVWFCSGQSNMAFTL